MNKQDKFISRVYEIISDLKRPFIDDSDLDNIKFKSHNAIVVVKFVFEEEESVIRGFLSLAEYFHSVIIKNKDKFYIPHDYKLFTLTND
jgi:hypothetical protein